jgi:negative regulator of flagellin synthesis FlgM
MPASGRLRKARPFDETKVSTAANMITQALSGTDARTEKIAALRQAIAAGTYNVSASDVADKVIGALLR